MTSNKWKFQDQTKTGEQWPMDEIKPYDRNAKKHPPSHINQLAGIIESTGMRTRIQITPDGTIINGHGRFEALKQLGFKKMPVSVIEDLDDAKIKALRLLDNKASGDEYDFDLMADELQDIADSLDFEMRDFFTDKEVAFVFDDLSEMGDDSLTGDLAGEVEAKSKETADSLDELDSGEYSLAQTLGFSKINGKQRRLIMLFKAHIEAETGEKGAEALAKYAQDWVL